MSVIRKSFFVLFIYISFISPYTKCNAQQYEPSLFFREDWKESPPAIPITQEHVSIDNLVLGLYGPGADSLKKSHHDQPVDDPFYVWSGECSENWAVTLRNSNSYVDFTNNAKIYWRSRQSGFRCLHLILKLADGTWLVSKQCDNNSKDWHIYEFNIKDMDWHSLNIKTVVEGEPIKAPDLSLIDEIGFTDLMRGGGSDASSRLDWIEVYGKRVDR